MTTYESDELKALAKQLSEFGNAKLSVAQQFKLTNTYSRLIKLAKGE